MKELGAVFGSVYGWERPDWFAPKGYAVPKEELGVGVDVLTNHNHAPPLEDGRIVEKWSFRRSNYFEHVGDEVQECDGQCRPAGHVGFRQDGGFGAGGAGVAGLQSSPTAFPKKQGRIALCHLLTKHGGVRSEFTVYEWAPGRFYLVSAGAYEAHDHDMLA